MPDRRWSEGIHQAMEAKEGLRVQRESVTLATVTFQNYFRLYAKLAGMTGTAMTEAEEFHKIYKLEVVSIPTNQPMIRDDEQDLVFRNEQGKFKALIDEIVEMRDAGRPVLVGTVSVEKSEILSELLGRRGIKHEVLNAKFHEKEAPIVAQAGRSGAVTIATNMAGPRHRHPARRQPAGLASEILHRRGLNPAEVDKATYDEAFAEAKAICDADHERVVAAGGLHIIGTERHDSRRIDNQLRGRAGRQGDPGSSRFYLSLEDDLMKRFASERVAGLMERLGLEDDVAIESRIVSKTIESAQTRVEGYNFDIRKRVVEFDDVINKQRETIYAERDKVLRNEDLTDTVRRVHRRRAGCASSTTYCAAEIPDDWNMEGLAAALHAMGLDGPGTSEDELWEIGSRDRRWPTTCASWPTRRSRRSRPRSAPSDWAMIERLVLLRTIDSLWIEHLTELDDMRRGIGLRGYAQQDPLNEFKKEAFSLYDQLGELIRHQVATTIFRVSVVRQPAAPTADEAQLAASLAAGAAAIQAGGAVAAAGGEPAAGPARGRRRRRTADERHVPGPRHLDLERPPDGTLAGGRRGGAEPARRAGPPGDAGAARRPGPDDAPKGASPAAGPSSAATTPAIAGPGSSTRSATAADASSRAVVAPRADPGRRSRVAVGGVARHRVWRRSGSGSAATVDETRPVDAIVVMGAAQYDGRPSPVFASRLEHAVRLYRRGRGARPDRDRRRREGDRTTEAAAARAYAVAHGVPDGAILDEDHGRSTLESLEAVAGDPARARAAQRAVRLGPDAHAARDPDGQGPGDRGVRLADDDEPDRCEPGVEARRDHPRAGRPGSATAWPAGRSARRSGLGELRRLRRRPAGAAGAPRRPAARSRLRRRVAARSAVGPSAAAALGSVPVSAGPGRERRNSRKTPSWPLRVAPVYSHHCHRPAPSTRPGANPVGPRLPDWMQ